MNLEVLKVGVKAIFTALLVVALVCVPSMTHPQDETHVIPHEFHLEGTLPHAMSKVRLESEVLLYDAMELRREVDAMCQRACGRVSTTSRAEARR